MTVAVDGETSDPAPVLSGVPQGTVLGPLLFLIYINDMPGVVSTGTFVRLFADDCLVYRQIQSVEDQNILQRDLLSLQLWADRWGMRFNPQKCNIMHINRGRNTKTRMYNLCNVVLDTVERAKYLGVTMSCDLSWHDHICNVAKKANTSLHFISRSLKHCPKSTRSTAYCSLTRSTLEYCASVWDPYQAQHKVMLEKINRRAARVVHNKSWYDRSVSPTALLDNLGWQPLEVRRQQQRMCLMYKITNGLVAVPPTRLQRPSRTTRGHPLKYQTARSTCDQVKHSFYPRSIRDWNNLHESVVTAPSLDSFKARLVKP